MPLRELTTDDVHFKVAWEPEKSWRDFFTNWRQGKKHCTTTWGCFSSRYTRSGRMHCAASDADICEDLTQWSNAEDAPAKVLQGLNRQVAEAYRILSNQFEFEPTARQPLQLIKREHQVALDVISDAFWGAYTQRVLLGAYGGALDEQALLEQSRSASLGVAPGADPFLLGFHLGVAGPRVG
jgi:hypothetical protein